MFIFLSFIMKKIISIIIFILVFLNNSSIYAYNINEWASTIESVINKLEWTDYTFKYNAWSSAKASYHIFYKWNMVWYIYSTDYGITLWEWWDSNWELWIFFNQTDLTIDQIIDRFYIDKSPLWESILDNNSYLCSWETKDFFRCLSNYSNLNKNSKWEIYLFDWDISKNIDINFQDDIILFKSIDSNWIELSCEIEKNKKDNLISMLWNWSTWAFSNKDFDYANCIEFDNNKNLNNSDFDIWDLVNLDLWNNFYNWDIDNSIINSNDFQDTIGWLVWVLNIPWVPWVTNFDKLGNSNDINNPNITNIDNKNVYNNNLINNKVNNTKINNELTYQDWLDIINDTNKKIDIINNNLKNDSLREKMLKYREMWNSIKSELEKNVEWKEWLRIKYLHKVIEEKYKELFKEYVLSQKNDNNKTNENQLINNSNIINNNEIINTKDKVINNSIINNNEKITNKDKVINNSNISNEMLDKSDLSDALLLNFKNLFYILWQKYNKQWNFSTLAKKDMEILFDKVDKNNEYDSINDFLISSPDILNKNSNIDLLQKLMIIMCKQ